MVKKRNKSKDEEGADNGAEDAPDHVEDAGADEVTNGKGKKGKGKGKDAKGKGKGKGKDAKGEGKGQKGKGKGKPAHDSEDPLVKEAIALILESIKDPNAQKDGKAFVPSQWNTTYKTKLGPYKKFLLAHPDEFALIEDGTGNFIIKRPQDVDDKEREVKQAPLIKGSTWQKKLIDAWMAYCLSTPREKRDFEMFLGPLPRTARSAKAGSVGAAEAAADESDKAAPSEEEQEASTKKKKRKAAEAPAEEPPAGERKKKKKRKATADA